MVKKKILFQSDSSIRKTGFGRNTKAILSYLYKTKKYDIVEYPNSIKDDDSILLNTPWRSFGCIPSNGAELELYFSKFEGQDLENKKKTLGYGECLLDNIIEAEKPDVYFAVQDIWGVDFAINKPWFDKINSVIWTTLDSLPILPSALQAAEKCENFWVWSNFAEKEMHKLGLKHVRTMHGAIDTKHFYKKNKEEKSTLRKNNNLKDEDLIIGFVFRNQLRKSVYVLFEALEKLKKIYPDKSLKLLLHTNWTEGWDLRKLASDHKIPTSDVLTTYICKNCNHYEVKPFCGITDKCNKCSTNNLVTTGPANGVSEEQLNEIYNLMDVYCHPFTSGGQEIPIEEAKLCELITLVTNYSCGEEACEPEAYSLPLSWTPYREIGSQFIKAATTTDSTVEMLKKVIEMPEEEKAFFGQKARKWVIDNFSIEAIGKKIEDFIDNQCNKKYDYSIIRVEKDPHAFVPNIENPTEWVKCLYKEILKINVTDKDEGLLHWVQRINNKENRQNIELFFRQTAAKELASSNKSKQLEAFKLDSSKKILFVIPEKEREVIYTLGAIQSAKEVYSGYKIVLATKKQYFYIAQPLVGKYIDQIIEYTEKLNDCIMMEGISENDRYFDICFNLKTFVNSYHYLKNGQDKIQFNIR